VREPGSYCTITSPNSSLDSSIPETAFQPVPVIESACDPTPARQGSWGELKLMYR